MKAYILRIENEKEKIPGTITPEYKTWPNMYRYYIKKYLAPGLYQVYLHYDKDKMYGKANKTFQIEILPHKKG